MHSAPSKKLRDSRNKLRPREVPTSDDLASPCEPHRFSSRRSSPEQVGQRPALRKLFARRHVPARQFCILNCRFCRPTSCPSRAFSDFRLLSSHFFLPNSYFILPHRPLRRFASAPKACKTRVTPAEIRIPSLRDRVALVLERVPSVLRPRDLRTRVRHVPSSSASRPFHSH